MKLKRILALFLSVIIISSLLAACKKDESEKKNNTVEVKETNSAEDDIAAVKAAAMGYFEAMSAWDDTKIAEYCKADSTAYEDYKSFSDGLKDKLTSVMSAIPTDSLDAGASESCKANVESFIKACYKLAPVIEEGNVELDGDSATIKCTSVLPDWGAGVDVFASTLVGMAKAEGKEMKDLPELLKQATEVAGSKMNESDTENEINLEIKLEKVDGKWVVATVNEVKAK